MEAQAHFPVAAFFRSGIAAALALAVGPLASQAGQNLLVNGSFE
jgi:hypothetical protein